MPEKQSESSPDEIGFWDPIDPLYFKEIGFLILFAIISTPFLFVSSEFSQGGLLSLSPWPRFSTAIILVSLLIISVHIYRGRTYREEGWFTAVAVSVFYAGLYVAMLYPLLIFLVAG